MTCSVAPPCAVTCKRDWTNINNKNKSKSNYKIVLFKFITNEKWVWIPFQEKYKRPKINQLY